MDVPAAWTHTLGDRSIRVAVVDSGVQGSHKELLARPGGKAKRLYDMQLELA